MKEHPILFSGEMVRAILDGRKTQTRRLVKPDPDATWGYSAGDDADGPSALEWAHITDSSLGHSGSGWYSTLSEYPDEGSVHFHCPYGAPGDRLWVRETWRTHERLDGLDGILYYADGGFQPIADTKDAADAWVSMNSHEVPRRWRPSIHMPRWASRLTLEVVAVRVERLQDITEADAEAEGLERNSDIDPMGSGLYSSAREEFAQLWNNINGKRMPWVLNPWVWVVTFKPL